MVFRKIIHFWKTMQAMPERRWVFDTVSLSNFLFADAAFILERRYGKRAMITSQVYDEIYEGVAKFNKLKTIDELVNNGIFKMYILSAKERDLYSRLIENLGKGEASCIAVAKEQSATVATDDKLARNFCSRMDIVVTGTIGILKASVLNGSIIAAQANDILQKMTNHGFYSPVRNIGNVI